MKRCSLTRRNQLVLLLVGLLITVPHPSATLAEPDYPKHLISFLTIGGSSTDVETRQVSWNLPQTGWRRFVQNRIRPQLDAGVRRILLHNPFGTLPGEPMQFDQYIHARDAGLDYLTQGFVEAWKPVVHGEYTSGEPVEVIAYLGKLRDDPDFQVLLDNGDTAGWLARAVVSVTPPLQAGMSIGFDASAPAPAQSPTHRLVRMIESLGVRVYIEARPGKDAPHWFAHNIIITDTFWNRSDPQRYPADSGTWAARNDQLGGEIIRIVRIPQARDPDNWMADVHRILDEGHTAAAPIYSLLKPGVSLDELLRDAVQKSD